MDALQLVIEKAYAGIDRDPQVLLEIEGGPVGMTADVVVARFYGFDDQVLNEVRLERPEPVIYTPRAVSYAMESGPELMPVDEWYLQSTWAKAKLAVSDAPPGTPHGDDFLVTVLCLRYRRRPAQ